LGDVEGQNLTVERYSGDGRPAAYADLAREVVSRNPDVIVDCRQALNLSSQFDDRTDHVGRALNRSPAQIACGDAVVDQPLQEPERCGSPFLF
jgi:hypothetical protein